MSRARAADRRTGREKGLSGPYWNTPTTSRRQPAVRDTEPGPSHVPQQQDNYRRLSEIALESSSDSATSPEAPQPPALWTATHQRAQRHQMRQENDLAYTSDSEEQRERTEKNRAIALKQHARQRELREKRRQNLKQNRKEME